MGLKKMVWRVYLHFEWAGFIFNCHVTLGQWELLQPLDKNNIKKIQKHSRVILHHRRSRKILYMVIG